MGAEAKSVTVTPYSSAHFSTMTYIFAVSRASRRTKSSTVTPGSASASHLGVPSASHSSGKDPAM